MDMKQLRFEADAVHIAGVRFGLRGDCIVSSQVPGGPPVTFPHPIRLPEELLANCRAQN